MNSEERISKLEERFSQNAAARNDQLSGYAADLAGVTEATHQIATGVADLAARLRAIENKPVPEPPGILTIWGPVIATALAVGTLGGFVLEQEARIWEAEIAPIRASVEHLGRLSDEGTKEQAASAQHLRDLDHSVNSVLSQELEDVKDRGRQEALQHQMDNMDSYGTRRWNESPPLHK